MFSIFIKKIFFLTFALLFLVPIVSSAEILRSNNFQILDPVINVGGVHSTSTNFDILQIFGQLGLGTSTANSFQLNPGFLTFPVVTLPTVTATAGDADVALSWSASVGQVGWSVSGYTVGQTTTSGGPYTYTSVGNVTSSTRAGLNNDTEYFFVVLPEDVFGNTLATSTQVSATPVAAAPPTTLSTGGGGPPFQIQKGAEVVFRGQSHPLSIVTLLEGSRTVVTANVRQNSQFELLATGLSEGVHTFSIVGKDAEGRRTPPISFTISATVDATVAIQDILLAPTFFADKGEVQRSELLYLTGQSAGNATISLIVISTETGRSFSFTNVFSNPLGFWQFSLDTSVFSFGTYRIYASVLKNDITSSFSFPIRFIVGQKTIFAKPTVCPLMGDLNNDCRVNLADFSIATFYYEKSLTALFKEIERDVLNGDGVVNLADFSLLAYYWTG